MNTGRRIVLRLGLSYSPVLLAAVPLFVPHCNSDYLGHAGFGYLLMPLGFIATLVCLATVSWKAEPGLRLHALVLASASLTIYALLSLGIAFLGAHAMNACFARYVNLEVSTKEWLFVWALLFPLALPLFA